jgi:hypothetical protein
MYYSSGSRGSFFSCRRRLAGGGIGEGGAGRASVSSNEKRQRIWGTDDINEKQGIGVGVDDVLASWREEPGGLARCSNSGGGRPVLCRLGLANKLLACSSVPLLPSL